MSTDYILRIGQVQDLRLFITISNTNGEEAHEATVIVQMPADFEYLGTDELVSFSSSHFVHVCNACVSSAYY